MLGVWLGRFSVGATLGFGEAVADGTGLGVGVTEGVGVGLGVGLEATGIVPVKVNWSKTPVGIPSMEASWIVAGAVPEVGILEEK